VAALIGVMNCRLTYVDARQRTNGTHPPRETKARNEFLVSLGTGFLGHWVVSLRNNPAARGRVQTNIMPERDSIINDFAFDSLKNLSACFRRWENRLTEQYFHARISPDRNGGLGRRLVVLHKSSP
jgi:hypothetical protein